MRTKVNIQLTSLLSFKKKPFALIPQKSTTELFFIPDPKHSLNQIVRNVPTNGPILYKSLIHQGIPSKKHSCEALQRYGDYCIVHTVLYRTVQ